ncbi:class E basic helix-loop-helix protein 40 [Protopterus annectens]|uniref:class E basic helix-loop-helix protein 40 n=1 Tax=Protopterus annectens TaxID=7888 RepID=UPI001CFBEDBB|nr:class E basic helix-loop-helix protein 40 [Protopterus annectens]
MERIPSAQPPPCIAKYPTLEPTDMQGMDISSMYVYKPSRRGIKRTEDSKETYKLPHRLIEKKRRDRINECIAQLKDLLPEHLKLTTLGHLEKAVVLELTLKHLKTLTAVIEQQQQKILSLQSGLKPGDPAVRSVDSSQDMFFSGFQLCAKEVLQFLAQHDSGRDFKPTHLINHLHEVVSDALQSGRSLRSEDSATDAMDLQEKNSSLSKTAEGHGRNCVPVIQRTFAHLSGEQSGSDTDTDSGYGGESEKSDSKSECQYYTQENELHYCMQERMNCIKQEKEDPPLKRARVCSTKSEPHHSNEHIVPPASFLGSHHHQPPLCLPFYLIPPSATGYLPMFEKCWYPASMPFLYSGLPASATAMTGLMHPDKLPSPIMMPPRGASPVLTQIPMDSSVLLQALKQVPPLNLETKE